MLLFGITLLDVINVVLVLIFIALGWQYFGAKWSYKISKPWSWEEGMVNHSLPAPLVRIERTYRDKVRLYTFWLTVKRLNQQRVGNHGTGTGLASSMRTTARTDS